MTIETKSVATNICASDAVCGPTGFETSLACSPIGYLEDASNGWTFEYGIITFTFYNNCSPQTLSSWLPYTITFRFCPYPYAPDETPNNSTFTSEWFDFAGVTISGYANRYRARATLAPASSSTITVAVYVQTLTSDNVWEDYVSWSDTMTETAGRVKQYDNRSYDTSTAYISISPSQNGGKGDVHYVAMDVGLVAYQLKCGSACGMFNSTVRGFLGCANAVVYSKTNAFMPTFFLLGRNASNCGSVSTQYCYCDTIELTNLTPVQGTTINNQYSGPSANDFVQKFGRVLGTEAVGQSQEVQIGVAQGEYLIIKVINEGSLNFISGNTGDWTSGAELVQSGNPTIYFLDRDDRYYYIYLFPFPDQDLSDPCGSYTTTPYPTPVSSTLPPETTTTSTTCAPVMAMMMAPEEETTQPPPPPTNGTRSVVHKLPITERQRIIQQRMQTMPKRNGCNCRKK